MNWARLNSEAPNSKTLYGLISPLEVGPFLTVSMIAFDKCPQLLDDGQLSVAIMGLEEEQSETSLAGICA